MVTDENGSDVTYSQRVSLYPDSRDTKQKELQSAVRKRTMSLERFKRQSRAVYPSRLRMRKIALLEALQLPPARQSRTFPLSQTLTATLFFGACHELSETGITH